MKVGARVLKTGIAISLSLLIAELLHIPSPAFAGVAAVFAVQPSIYQSYLTMVEQVVANLIGAVIAFVFVMTLGVHPLIVGFAALATILILLQLKNESAIPVALVTVIAIMESNSEAFYWFAFERFSTILLGILCAFIVNLFFLPPKYESRLYFDLEATTEGILKWLRQSLHGGTDQSQLKEDIEHIRERMLKLNHLYVLFKEEREPFRRHNLDKSRKLVLFRQLLATTTRSFTMLKSFHRFHHEFHHMPEQFQDGLRHELQCLLHFHEHLLLRFIGKVNETNGEDMYIDANEGRKEVFQQFLTFATQSDEAHQQYAYHMVTFIGNMIDYYDQLEHLARLVESFQHYHQEQIVTPHRN